MAFGEDQYDPRETRNMRDAAISAYPTQPWSPQGEAEQMKRIHQQRAEAASALGGAVPISQDTPVQTISRAMREAADLMAQVDDLAAKLLGEEPMGEADGNRKDPRTVMGSLGELEGIAYDLMMAGRRAHYSLNRIHRAIRLGSNEPR